MSIEQMRELLKRKYKYADKWCKRVNAMSDRQIIAIYFRMYMNNNK